MTSRMFSRPVANSSRRSKPRPKPLCGTEPYCKHTKREACWLQQELDADHHFITSRELSNQEGGGSASVQLDGRGMQRDGKSQVDKNTQEIPQGMTHLGESI